MITKIARRVGWVAVLGCLMLWAACGSSEGPQKKEEGQKKDGRIYLRNKLTATVKVSYLNEEEGQIDTTVEPGEEKDISQHVLEGGTKVVVYARALVNNDASVVIPITVDGPILIRITELGSWGGGGLRYELQ